MAVESSADSYINAQPEEAMSFEDWRSQSKYHGFVDPDSLVGRVVNFFDGSRDKQYRDYQTYLDNLDRQNEFISQQSARGYDKMMDDTKYQRMMKDFQAAGLNPYLLVNNGGISASSSPSGAKADYGKHQVYQKQKTSDAGRNIALLLLAVAKVAAALM